MAQGLIDARWVGPFEAALPDGTVLVPSETVVKLPRDEAEKSDNWQPVGARSEPTVTEIREELEARGVEIPKGAKKAKLAELLADAESESAPPQEPEDSEPSDEGAED